jgi:hypothetical protein
VDGTTTSSRSVWTIVDENTITIKYTQRKQGNRELPDMTERYVRKVLTASYEDFLEWGNRLEGRWVGKVTLIADWPGFNKKAGDVVESHVTYRWVADKRGLEQVETGAGNESLFHNSSSGLFAMTFEPEALTACLPFWP